MDNKEKKQLEITAMKIRMALLKAHSMQNPVIPAAHCHLPIF